MVKRVICNSCAITLEVPQRNGEPFREINCPNCSHQLRVTFGNPQLDDHSKTVYGGMQGVSSFSHHDDEALTQLSLASSSSERIGVLLWGEASFPLHLGRNLVGRESKSSNADIQIPTDDIQMSREHAIISVMRIANGSLRTLICNNKDCVTTFVNDMQLLADDEVVLRSGTNLTLGNTTITYVDESDGDFQS